ncbi:MAG: MarR family transcriptional regulator [Glaciihabitans sp.]|nr:MarR family transcriptional regulator [Glaciihabitans sp.]
MDNENFDSDLRVTIQRLARRLRSEKADDRISDTQFSVLCVLAREGAMGLGDLSAHERVTPPSMNRTVNALVEAGYASRSGSPDDGRKIVLDVTEGGHTVIAETRRRRDAWFSLRLADLAPEQRATLAAAAPILKELAEL